MADEPAPTDSPLSTARVFLLVEHGVYTALGALLSIVAIVALVHAGMEVVADIVAFNEAERVFVVMDHLLFVLMLVEILHTVRVSIRSGSLNAEPFLIVGLIASIRRVLVITLESSNATKSGGQTIDAESIFKHSMIELGVLAVLILVMVVSIFMIRTAARRLGGAVESA